MHKDLSDLEDWELLPDADEARQLKGAFTDQSFSVDTDTSLECYPSSPTIHKSDTFDSQTELAELEKDVESPKHGRYHSPLFQSLLNSPPIEPVKVTQQSIPEDNSINNLLYAANLVSQSQKPPVVEKLETLTQINETNDEESEEAVDERLFLQLSFSDKRPSMQDPEQVLMKNVVPGETASSFPSTLF